METRQKRQGYILHRDRTPRHRPSAPTWNMEMFSLSVSWSERAAVWPVRERGVRPLDGLTPGEKNGENKMRGGRARKKTKQV